ncbi:MAG: beta-L-arabinofuranosidase domain-containing protein [Microbacteriaceae bacterium]
MKTTAGPMAPSLLGVVSPIGGGDVRLGDGTLGRWQQRNRSAVIPHGIAELEGQGALDNLRWLVGASDAPFRGPVFIDSDVYKVLEAVAWELGRADDPALRAFYEGTLVLLVDVQDADGYLDSAFQRADRVQERWSDFASGHELYCAGHLIQAAVASVRALGDDRLLAIAVRFADLIVRLFGGSDSPVYPGHPEIEYALVELFRLTGRREYLDTAKAFVDRRGAGWLGRGAFGSMYFQDDASLRETSVMRGHAVRALYLNSGAADVYLETGDISLLTALNAQWDDMVTRRSYITGATGSRHKDESFGDAYELPSDRAYAETCAGIAAMHWAWRMYTATGEAQYPDFFETALYNVVAAGSSEQGTAFFYSNPLQLRADHTSAQEEATARRLDWYFCACCPPNLMRTFASVESYLASVAGDELQLVQYTRARIEADMDRGRVVLDVDTDYPVSGDVLITVVEGFEGGTLALRVPGWNTKRSVHVNGRLVDGAHTDADADVGWLRLPNALAAGTVIRLEFDMPPVFLTGDRRIDAVRGAVALRRGPVVYCLEQSDNSSDVEQVSVDPEQTPAELEASTALGPIVRSAGVARASRPASAHAPAHAPLYAPWPVSHDTEVLPVDLRFRPYATWGNASPGAMRVWVPTSD